MDDIDELPRLRLRRPQDLIEAVPYLLGFHPRNSVVLVGLAPLPGPATPDPAGGLGRVQITARMDIGDLCDGVRPAAPAAPSLDSCEQFADGAAAALNRAGARTVVGIVFTEAGFMAQRCVQAMTRAGAACERAGVSMLDWLVVTGDPGHRAGPTDPGGGPSEAAPSSYAHPGRSATGPPRPGVVAAEATYAGLVAWPDRADLVRLLDPDLTEDRARLRPWLEQAGCAITQEILAGRQDRFHRSAVRRLFIAGRNSAQSSAAAAPAGAVPVGSGRLSDADLVRLGSVLSNIDVRDACWLAIERGRLDGETLWRELARRLPGPYDAAALFLFGWQRWRAGDGVLAGIAVQRALDSDPGYRAAHLLDSALRNGMDPFRTPRLRKGA